MKKLLKFLTLFFLLFVLAIIVVIALLDINQYKNEISQLVKDETGLDLEINGDLYFSIFSGVKIKASDIKLLNNKNLIIHVDSIVLGSSLVSLYKNKPEINSLEVIIKKLNLTRNKQGKYEFLPLSEQTINKSGKENNTMSVKRYFLENLSIKNVQLSVGEFQFVDNVNSLSVKLEAFKIDLSVLQIIDHYELVVDDPSVLVDYIYSGDISAKKALFNQYHLSDLSLSFKARQGHITAEQLGFHLIQQDKGLDVKKLDMTAEGKLSLVINYSIPEGGFEPLWGQPRDIKITEIDINLPGLLLSQKDFHLNMKQSRVVMGELALFENRHSVLNNLLLKSLVFTSGQIEISPHSKDKYYLTNSILKIKNLPVMAKNKLLTPQSNQFLKKFAQNAQIDLSIDSLVENKERGISQLKMILQGSDKKITLSKLSFKAIDSEINAVGAISLQKKVPLWNLEIYSDKLNLGPVCELLNTSSIAEGYISINNKLSGTVENSDFKITDGRVHARASNIIVDGMDLDKVLNDFENSQSIGLLDVGAVALLGPAGIALSKGNDYTKLIHRLGKGGKSTIVQLNSDISFSNDIASMDDVSFTTARHQLAIKGKINMLDETFINFKVATIDKDGCPIYQEEVQGSLTSPAAKPTNILVSGVVNPLKSVTQKLGKKIMTKCKEPFYKGVIKLN